MATPLQYLWWDYLRVCCTIRRISPHVGSIPVAGYILLRSMYVRSAITNVANMITSEKAKFIVITSHWRLVYTHHKLAVQIKLYQDRDAHTSVFFFYLFFYKIDIFGV